MYGFRPDGVLHPLPHEHAGGVQTPPVLKSEGYLEVTDGTDNPSGAMFTVSREDLYKVQVSRRARYITWLLLRTYRGSSAGVREY